MVTRSKTANLRQIPDCVAATYKQLVQGLQILDLGHGAHVHLVPSIKDILLFLCCRDKQRENAYALWNEVRRLRGAGIAYEMEAADLLTDTVTCVIDYYGGLTRSELRALDDEVARAADNLRTAILRHSDDKASPPAAITLPGAEAVVFDQAPLPDLFEPLVRRNRPPSNQAFHPPNRKP